MSLKNQIKVALLGVIAFIIMFLEMPIPLFPMFLKLDISDLPAVVAGLAMGPTAGVLVELLKNVLHLLKTDTGGVGELANFIVGGSYVFTISYIYYRNKTLKSAVIGAVAATLVMAVAGGIINYAVILPFYAKIMPLDEIIKLSALANTAIVDMKTLIFYAIVPFNALKGIFIAILTLLIYKKVMPLLSEK